MLKDYILRFWWLDIDGSALLKRISATLPMAGEYRIWKVEQFKWGHSDKFLGHYCLTLQSPQAAWRTLEPTAWLE